MKTTILLAGVCPRFVNLLTLLCSDRVNIIALANDDAINGFIALDNEIALDNDGWALLAPLGEHRKTRSVQRGSEIVEEHYVQIVDDAAIADVLANEQGEGILARIKRAFIKRPIYNGHPDVKLYAPETVTHGNDQLIPLGVNDGLRQTTRGLEFKPLLVPAGATAVEAGSKYPSALFLLKRTGRVRDNGDIEVRPFKVASIGLTPFPNISGVDSLANARANTPAASEETKTQDDTMKQILIGWLAAQGIALANDSTEQAVFDAFQKHVGTQTASVTALGNEKSSLTATVNTITAERDAQKQRADEAALALANEQTAFKAERTARCEALVDLAITQGKLPVADRAAKVTTLVALANDALTAEIAALEKLPAKFATASATGNRKGESNPTTAGVALANEITALVKTGKTQGQALDEIIRTKPEIYRAYRAEGGSLAV